MVTFHLSVQLERDQELAQILRSKILQQRFQHLLWSVYSQRPFDVISDSLDKKGWDLVGGVGDVLQRLKARTVTPWSVSCCRRATALRRDMLGNLRTPTVRKRSMITNTTFALMRRSGLNGGLRRAPITRLTVPVTGTDMSLPVALVPSEESYFRGLMISDRLVQTMLSRSPRSRLFRWLLKRLFKDVADDLLAHADWNHVEETWEESSDEEQCGL